VGCLMVGGMARATIRPPSAPRRLKLFNAHTHETFDGPYRAVDGVITSAASDLSEFLRDFHSGVAATMDVAVIDFLSDVLDAVGARGATILSAYRTPETNAMLARTMFGVAEHSQHIYARAIDFTIDAALPEAMAAARKMRRGGVGWYPQSYFIHIDTGPVRNWDLGEGNLQQLLENPVGRDIGGLRSASATRAPTRQQPPPASQYDRLGGLGDAQIRPSQYNAGSYGARNGPGRLSQYSYGS